MKDLWRDRDLDWYVLTVSPLCETAVASRIKRLFGGERSEDGKVAAPDGVATWVPMVSSWRKRQHGRVLVERLLIPRYLFFGFGRGAVPWFDIRDVMGVQGVVCFDGRPARVAAETVGDLMIRIDRGAFAEREPPKVQRGMRVVADRGLFKGLEGDVVTLDKGREMVGVLFDSVFTGGLPIEMRLDDVVSVSYCSQRMSG